MPEAPAAPTPAAPSQTMAPAKTIGGSFFEKMAGAPEAHELKAGATPPSGPASTEAPKTPEQDPIAPPSSTPKPAEPQLEKPARLETPVKKEEAPAEAAKPDEVDEYLGLSDEDQEAKLSKLSKTDAHKLARKAFNRAGRLLQDRDTLAKKLKDMEASGKEVEDLKKKIAHLEDGPETKATQAAITKAQGELKKAQEDFAADKERVEKDKKYVEGLQLAHDVKKTPKWKQYVSEPSQELVDDIKMLSASIGEDEATRNLVFDSIIYALNQGDEATRWRALKEAGKDLSSADQTMLSQIFKAHQRIEKNKLFLQGASEEGRKALDEGRERETKEKAEARTKEYSDGAAMARENFTKDLPWISDDFPLDKYPEEFKKTITDTRAFAKRLESTDLTPGQEAKVKQGFAYFQGAAILARNYSKALEVENTQLREALKVHEDKVAAEAAAEAEKEKNKGELTPSAAPKKGTVVTKPAAATTGPVRSVGATFASLVAKGA